MFSRKDPIQDHLTSSSFNVFRGLYPPHSSTPHLDNEYPYPQPQPQPQPHYQPVPQIPHSHGVFNGCSTCPKFNVYVFPAQGQYLDQPRVKHTVKSVTTDVKEVTTFLSDGGARGAHPHGRAFNLTGAAIGEHGGPLSNEDHSDETNGDQPSAALDPLELEDNLIAGRPPFNAERGFLFQPAFGISRPVPQGNRPILSQGQAFYPQQRTFNPNLAYLRPRPVTQKDDVPEVSAPQQWRPSNSQLSHSSSVSPRPLGLSTQKSSSHPCQDTEKDAKEAKINSKNDN